MTALVVVQDFSCLLIGAILLASEAGRLCRHALLAGILAVTRLQYLPGLVSTSSAFTHPAAGCKRTFAGCSSGVCTTAQVQSVCSAAFAQDGLPSSLHCAWQCNLALVDRLT